MARAIDQFLAAIRQAIYGRDVREAIASGIEQCYEDSTASAQKADIEAKGAEVLASIPDTYEDLQSNVDNLKSALNDQNESVEMLALHNTLKQYIDCEWVKNRALVTNGVLTEMVSNQFAHSAFLLMTKNATMSIASGYKLMALEGAYNEFGHECNIIGGGWKEGSISYTYRSAYPYLMLCVMKSDSSVITPTEATKAISLYVESETVLALKASVADVETELETTNDNLNKIDLKNGVVLSNEISKQYTLTSGSYLSAVNGRIVSTSADYSVTSDIKVDAGTVIYIPNVNVSASVALLGLKVISPTVLYSILAVGADLTENGNYFVIDKDCEVIVSGPSSFIDSVKFYKSNVLDISKTIAESLDSNNLLPIATAGQVCYNGDTKVNDGHICNAIAYDDGIIIAARSNGKIVRIGYDGTEETLLSITATNMDWRLLWMDSRENVYASPHASLGSLNRQDRGLYKLRKGESSFTKVISLYNPNSSIQTEAESNDDTIWTMCEDSKHVLYAGVYAHTVRANPAIYKSTDGGNNWTYFVNFNTKGLTENGMHIHSIVYSKWQNALYCIVGEINTIFKSTDGGANWTNLNVVLNVKGSAMLATEYGIFIGSDGSRYCDIDWLHNDDYTHKRVFRGWANTIFAIRRSDETGFLYAFTKVDSSVNATNRNGYNYIYPPTSVFDADDLWTAINEWKTHISQAQYDEWYQYYQDIINDYPDDAIRPRHSAILVSRNGGKSWEVLKSFDLGVNPSTGATYVDGFWTTGYFQNGECLTGRMKDNQIHNPVVISEGKHKYVAGGCDFDGEIFIRTNNSNVAEII